MLSLRWPAVKQVYIPRNIPQRILDLDTLPQFCGEWITSRIEMIPSPTTKPEILA